MKYYKFLLVILLFTGALQAQTDLKQIVPSNPNVASLFKSTLTPVSEYSGSANINIPLFTLNEGMISIPISIGYATGGIQVGEEASVIGLGWSLNAGGAITRIINGVDDFDDKGILNNNKQHPDFPIDRANTSAMATFWNSSPFIESTDVPGSNKESNCNFPSGNSSGYDLPPKSTYIKDNDFMHDTFMYNFNGRSGSFVLNKNSDQAFLMNKKPIKIWYEVGVGTNSDVVFKVLTEEGTEYSFLQRAWTYFINSNLDDFVSSWYLKEIRDIYGNQAIFNYNTDNYFYPFRTFNQAFFATEDSSSSNSSYFKEMVGPTTKVDDILLTSIEIIKNGQIVQTAVFDYSDPPTQGMGGERKDLDSSFLKSLKIFNNIENEPIEEIAFHNSYFGTEQSYTTRNISLSAGDFGSTIGAFDPKYPHINLRLKLDSIIRNNNERYRFSYDSGSSVPNKTSMSQDYWGFYNGRFNPDVFIPEISSWQEGQVTVPQQKKANRLPDEDHCKMFSLKSIEYPTKGITEYEYELNTFDQTYNAIPAATTLKPYFATSPGPGDEKIITPNQDKTLTVRFNVAVTGWNEEKSIARFGTNKPAQPTNWENMFYVQLEKLNGTVITKVTLDSESNDWTSLENNYTNPLIKQEVFDFSYDFNTPSHLKLDENQYRLRAVFDDDDGLYYGQAHISTEIQEIDVSETEKYSVGGGLRISKIINKDNDGSLITENDFSYHYKELDENNVEVTKSYGRIKAAPNFSLDKRTVWHLSILLSDGELYGALPLMIGAAGSQTPWSRDMGSFVGYDKVESFQVSEGLSNGKTVKSFVNQADTFRTGRGGLIYADDYYKFPPIRVPHNGLLLLEETYNKAGELVQALENGYSVNGTDAKLYNLGTQFFQNDFVLSASKELPIDNIGSAQSTYYFCDAMKFQFYPHYSNLIQQTGTKKTIYNSEGIDSLITVEEFKYENPIHFQRTESKLINSKGEELITKTFYPDDIFDENGNLVSTWGNLPISSEETTEINKLTKDYRHRIAEPIQTETILNGETTVQRTYYKDWDSTPSLNSTKVWPKIVKTLKGDYDNGNGVTANVLENLLNYYRYDDFGNPLMVSKQDGSKISYIWGYNKKYPVAKVENASYTEIEGVLGTGLNLGNGGLTDSQANDLRTNLTDAMVTTYTYNPLIGVTSVTDPRGYTMKYGYDSLNRLKEIRDENDNLVRDYKYHYKGENDQY